MKNLTTLLAFAPLTIFSQNVVFTNVPVQNITLQGNGTAFNSNVQTMNYSNILHITNNTNNTINTTRNYAVVNVTPKAQTVPVRRNTNTSANRARPNTSRGAVARHRPAPTQAQVAQVAQQTNKQSTVVAQANPVNNIKNDDSNFGEKNIYVALDNNVGNRGGNYYQVNYSNNIETNEIPQQAQVFNPVQQTKESPVQVSSGNGSNFSLPKISFGGKAKSAGAHSTKKHTLKKFFVKVGRKMGAKHGGKKKHFILDKCASFFKC